MLDKSKDFINQVSNFIQDTTMTSKVWAEAISLNMLSTVMGPERYISDEKGKLNLNVWSLIIGPSGIGQKTTPIKTYLLPILAKTTEELPDKYPLILPSRYSVERMIAYMAEKNLGSIVRDEFTSMFKEAYSKEYLADSLEFLSELYDGIIQPRATWGHGINKMTKCYVTLIAATTPYLYKVMKPDFFTQGTGNRILLIVFDVENVEDKKLNHETFFRGPAFEEKRENFIDDIAEHLAKLRHARVRYFIPDEDAARIWTKYELECRTISKKRFKKNTFDIHYSYLSRLPEMALKLAGLYAVSRTWGILCLSGCPPEMLVLEQDMNRAINRVKLHYDYFCKMLEQWRTRPERGIAYSFEEQAEFILEKVKSSPGIGWTELRRIGKWDTRTWREVLKYLHQAEEIVIVLGKSRGRPPTLFYSNPPPFNLNSTNTKKVFKDWRQIEGWLNLR